jgi:molybdopterin-guanine dinucleotide biosynthesis protein A
MLVGIFVGGASKRMGTPKGLLPIDGSTLLARAIAEVPYPLVLVGDATPYATSLERLLRSEWLECLDDRPRGIGPLGGLRALLLRAPRAIALACDMPFFRRADVIALAEHASDAPIVAARRERFEPFFARYDSARVLPAIDDAIARGEHSLQRLFARLEVDEFQPITTRALEDWDTPDDVTRGGSSRG